MTLPGIFSDSSHLQKSKRVHTPVCRESDPKLTIAQTGKQAEDTITTR